MENKILTLSDLYDFCKSGQITRFNAQESGYSLSIQSYGYAEFNDQTTLGLIPVQLKLCHTELNRNKSFISMSAMSSALPSLANRPILAHIIQLDDGTYDFHSHDISIDENEQIVYIEQPIGIIPESCNAEIVYDDHKRKNYVHAKGFIFEDYGNKAIEIIKSKKTIRISVELCINQFTWNSEKRCLEIEDFYFNGVTCLGKEKDGTEIMEGMEGANLTIETFRMNDPEPYEIKMLEALDKLNNTLSNFQIDNQSTKGGTQVDKIENNIFEENNESVEQPEKSEQELSTENIVEPVKTEETFDDDSDNTSQVDLSVVQPEGTNDKLDKYSICKNGIVISEYEVSWNDVLIALDELVNATYSGSDNTYYRITVYDDYLVMSDYWSNKHYKQEYDIEDSKYVLVGNRIEVFPNFLTKEEEERLEGIRSTYDELAEKVKKYELLESRSKKYEILNQNKFAVLNNYKDFNDLKDNIDNYDLKDIETKAKVILADYIDEVGEFSFNNGVRKTNKLCFDINKEPKKRGSYGNLFKDRRK